MVDDALTHCASAARQIDDCCRTLYSLDIPACHKQSNEKSHITIVIARNRHKYRRAEIRSASSGNKITREYSRWLLRVVRKGSREPRVGRRARSERTLAQCEVPALPAMRPRARFLQQPTLRQRTARCCLRRYTRTSPMALCLVDLKQWRDLGSESSTSCVTPMWIVQNRSARM